MCLTLRCLQKSGAAGKECQGDEGLKAVNDYHLYIVVFSADLLCSCCM